MANKKTQATQEQATQATQEQATQEQATQLITQEQAQAQAEELANLKNNPLVRAVNSMAQFIDDTPVVTEDTYIVYEDGKAVLDEEGKEKTAIAYNVVIGSKTKPISNKALAQEIEQLVIIFRLGKASTYTVYGKLAQLGIDGNLLKETGYEDVVDFGADLLGIKRDTVRQYLNSINKFYNVTPTGITPVDMVYNKVSLTNLNQIIGMVNDKADGDPVKFAAMYIKNGKLDITLSKPKLDKALAKLKAEIDGNNGNNGNNGNTGNADGNNGNTGNTGNTGNADGNTGNTDGNTGNADGNTGTETIKPVIKSTPTATVTYYATCISDVFANTEKMNRALELLNELEQLAKELEEATQGQEQAQEQAQ